MNEAELKPNAALLSNPLAKGLMVGKGRRGVVFMPSAFNKKKRYRFRPIQIRFLHGFANGESFETLCKKLEITPEYAFKMLDRKKCKDYLAELDSMEADNLAVTSRERLVHEFHDVWEGKVKKDREQMEAGKELLARFAPRPEKAAGNHVDNMNIVINVNKIDEAFKRQEIMAAEIVAETLK